jgi:hypothetical protein
MVINRSELVGFSLTPALHQTRFRRLIKAANCRIRTLLTPVMADTTATTASRAPTKAAPALALVHRIAPSTAVITAEVEAVAVAAKAASKADTTATTASRAPTTAAHRIPPITAVITAEVEAVAAKAASKSATDMRHVVV